MAGTCYDILRVWAVCEGSALDSCNLGGLQNALREYGKRTVAAEEPLGSLPRWSEFMDSLDLSRNLRNDLMHALPVLNGLLRRGSKVIAADAWPFFTIESLVDIAASFELTSRLGNGLLYSDGGSRVEEWSSKPQ